MTKDGGTKAMCVVPESPEAVRMSSERVRVEQVIPSVALQKVTSRFASEPHVVAHGHHAWRETWLRRGLLSAFVGGLACTAALVSLMTICSSRGQWGLVGSVAPLIALSSLAGVALPTYMALELGHRHEWLMAATAWSVGLFIAFTMFWSGALVTAPGPSAMRVGQVAVPALVHFERVSWLRDLSARGAMVEDLVNSERLRGLTAAQVTTELGAPARVVGPGVSEMWYRISTDPDDRAMFAVSFSQGRVASAAVRESPQRPAAPGADPAP